MASIGSAWLHFWEMRLQQLQRRFRQFSIGRYLSADDVKDGRRTFSVNLEPIVAAHRGRILAAVLVERADSGEAPNDAVLCQRLSEKAIGGVEKIVLFVVRAFRVPVDRRRK